GSHLGLLRQRTPAPADRCSARELTRRSADAPTRFRLKRAKADANKQDVPATAPTHPRECGRVRSWGLWASDQAGWDASLVRYGLLTTDSVDSARHVRIPRMAGTPAFAREVVDEPDQPHRHLGGGWLAGV